MQGFLWVHEPAPRPVVPGYTILDSLGQGAQGSVFRARHALLQRDVALKVVFRDALGPAGQARFRREAELLARFDHPGVIRVHQWGETPELLYLDCELVEGGRPFDEACEERELAGRVELIAQLFEVLAAVHALGVVHRDLKPGNVLVTDGRVKLLDFGIATAGGLRRLTLSGQFVGTLLYAAPERLNLLVHTESPSGDVWSAGAVACEVLTGCAPYACATFSELAALALEPAPSLAARRPGLPRALVRALDAALAYAPDDRPAAAEVARALRDGTAPRGSRRVGPWATLAAAVLGVAGAGAWLAGDRRAPAPSPPTPTPDQRVRDVLRAGAGAPELAVQRGDEDAVDRLARALLPPAPEDPVPPPEWQRLSARVGAAGGALRQLVVRAQRGAPWAELLDGIEAARAAHPEAPWDVCQGLLAYQRGVPQTPLLDRGDAWDPWRELVRDLCAGATRLDALSAAADEDLRALAGAYAVLRERATRPSDPEVARRSAERAQDVGRLGISVALGDAQLADYGAALAFLDRPHPGGGLLYARLLAERAGVALQRITSRRAPTSFELRIAERFLELSCDLLPESKGLHLMLLTEALEAYPQLRDYVREQSEARAVRPHGLSRELLSVAAHARAIPPLPCYGTPLPPEWEARVAELPAAPGAALREAVERARAGAPWSEVEATLAQAIADAPSTTRELRVARALLCLARRASGVVSLDQATLGLPGPWERFVRACWQGRDVPPELTTLSLEAEVQTAIGQGNTARLRALRRRHSMAEFLLEYREPDAGRPELLEQYDRAVRSMGALYVNVLAVRTAAAWHWAAREARVAVGEYAVARGAALAPDGPALLRFVVSGVGTRPAFQELVLTQAEGWPTSADGLRLAAACSGTSSEAARERAREFLRRADVLEPEHPPSAKERELRESLNLLQPR